MPSKPSDKDLATVVVQQAIAMVTASFGNDDHMIQTIAKESVLPHNTMSALARLVSFSMKIVAAEAGLPPRAAQEVWERAALLFAAVENR